MSCCCMVFSAWIDGLIRPRDDQFANFAGIVLGFDDFAGGDFHGGVAIIAFAHPLVVVNLAEVAHARVWQERDDERFGAEIFRKRAWRKCSRRRNRR